MPASHRGGEPSRYKRPRLDCHEHGAPGSSRHTMRPRGEQEDDEDLNLLPSSSAFNDAAAARAADPLGLNEALWKKGWEGGKLYISATPADAATVDEPAASPHPSDEEGASDFSDEDERAAYVSVRRASRIERQGEERKKELEERRLARIKALEDADAGKGAEEGSSRSAQPTRDPSPLNKATFNLMAKTAAAIRGSTKPKQLELRILTHHGGDERFAFLRRDGGKAHEVWERLKAGEALKWEDVDEREEAEARRKGEAVGLLSGYDSDSDCEEEEKEESAPVAGEGKEAGKEEDEATTPLEATSVTESKASTEDIDTGQKAKDRIARARQWAAQQRATKEAAQPAVSEA